MAIDNLKICRRCQQSFPKTVEFFGRNGRFLRSYCKSCQTKNHADWVHCNHKKSRAIAKRFYDRHREKIIIKTITRDKVLRADPILGPMRRAQYAAMARRRLSNPEYRAKIREWQRHHAKTEKGSARYIRRRAMEAGAEGLYTKSDVQRKVKAQRYRCYWCKGDIWVGATADHYIPLSLGGSNWPSNIVAACGRCNSRKHNKMPNEFRRFLALYGV